MWPTTQAPHYAIAILGGSGQANGSGDYFDGEKKETPYVLERIMLRLDV